MTLGSPVVAQLSFIDRVVRPAQIPNPWVAAVDAGGVDNSDGSPIQNPTSEITETTTHIVKVGKKGTTLRVRCAYLSGTSTVTTSPIIQVFARYNSNDPWQKLTNKSGDHLVTLTLVLTTDVDDGTFLYSDVDPDDHSWDLDGCDEVLIGIHTIVNLDAGEASVKIQAKVI